MLGSMSDLDNDAFTDAFMVAHEIGHSVGSGTIRNRTVSPSLIFAFRSMIALIEPLSRAIVLIVCVYFLPYL